ncbi:hypothetical protein [Paracoccus sp. Z118]|uniref:hypothetical protein n=1 Tax=Paracoccus sp. Z118 TaxID=2851017 RepID=UPI0020B6C47A|nr:hypothetical protein [Paracoccus sp. Z118]
MNGIFGMLARMVTRRAMNWGVNKGIDRMSRSGKGGVPNGQPSAAAKKQAKDMRQAVKRARQAARITRRFGR